MSDSGVVDRQKNLLQIEALATEAITTAVRGLLPVKQILQDYLGEDEEEIEESPTAVQAETTAKEEEKEAIKEAVKEEVKEETKAAASDVKDIGGPAPAVVSIDTEPTVHFSDYDSVFDEAKGEPQMRYSPKEEDGDDDIPSDAITVNESTSAPLGADDVEDLDAPIPKPVVAPKKDTLSDDEVVILE
jgi:hypothetical protein